MAREVEFTFVNEPAELPDAFLEALARLLLDKVDSCRARETSQSDRVAPYEGEKTPRFVSLRQIHYPQARQ
jgi:hypothetical protein